MRPATRHRLVACLVAAVCLASAGRALAEPFTTVRNNGPSANRVDLVIMGDGFTAAQIAAGAYAAEIETQIQRLFAQEPYLEYNRFLNVHRINVTSNQAGADHPSLGMFVDTALTPRTTAPGSSASSASPPRR